MSAAAQAIRDLVEPVLGAGWVVQFGEWRDPGQQSKQRVFVLRPAGGVAAELLRRPAFVAQFIGIDGGDLDATSQAADRVVEAIRSSAGRLVYVEAGEPVFVPTQDRRPVFEIALSAIH